MRVEDYPMKKKVLKIDPKDNLIVALEDLSEGDKVIYQDEVHLIVGDVPTKHKFAARDFHSGDILKLYGVPVGKANDDIPAGTRITTKNASHFSAEYQLNDIVPNWRAPDASKFAKRTFRGYPREDGKVGTRNFWLVIPLVFCENRNVEVIRETLLEKLGYQLDRDYAFDLDRLIEKYRSGEGPEALMETEIVQTAGEIKNNRLFPNVDGIKFLTHQGGCGGTRQDADSLCGLLAGYLNHPNVAGATILSLGCQNAQIPLLEKALRAISPDFNKPLYVLEQQGSASERAFIAEAVKKTFVGLVKANESRRTDAALAHLSLGLECGGSDGFSGISANPALGYCVDLLVALGGRAILAEFPELNGVEQELISRCVSRDKAEKFVDLMRRYAQRAEEVGSGFDSNPSPGNIKDGLITDAMKSAGAAKKGGTSPVVDVLDYTEQPTRSGLHLLCTPGNDVESTTALAGSGANLIVFTTGLGTPTGNPVAPTVKMSSNTALANRMSDLIDIDAGTIISGEDTIESKGEALLELLIRTASGEVLTKAEQLGQDDFIPWKRGVSL